MVLMLIVSVGEVERRKEKERGEEAHLFCVYGEVFTCPATFLTLLLFVINLSHEDAKSPSSLSFALSLQLFSVLLFLKE